MILTDNDLTHIYKSEMIKEMVHKELKMFCMNGMDQASRYKRLQTY